jgi:putative hemolysin
VISHTGQPSTPLKSASAPAIQVPQVTLVPSWPDAPERPNINAEVGRYRLRLAQTVEDRDAACRLRFRVFNIEMGEGLASSYETGLDTDHFDLFCEHLLVEDKLETNPVRKVVGTYRMQSGVTAALNLGYYSEQEFDFTPYESQRACILELGRASIHREHRTPEVLTLLWRGIAQYASDMGLRYLIGCSSLNSRNPEEGWDVHRQLEKYLVSPELMTQPRAAYACPAPQMVSAAQPGNGQTDLRSAVPALVPRLLKTYLAIGARICAAPAWDREFGTIDFLTLLDLQMLSTAARNRFLAPLTA